MKNGIAAISACSAAAVVFSVFGSPHCASAAEADGALKAGGDYAYTIGVCIRYVSTQEDWDHVLGASIWKLNPNDNQSTHDAKRLWRMAFEEGRNETLIKTDPRMNNARCERMIRDAEAALAKHGWQSY